MTHRIERLCRVLTATLRNYPFQAAFSIAIPSTSASRNISTSSLVRWGVAQELSAPSVSDFSGTALGNELETVLGTEQNWYSEKINDQVDPDMLDIFPVYPNCPTSTDVWKESSAESAWENVPVVVATSSFETDPKTGSIISSIDVSWSERDNLNCRKDLQCKTRLDADFEAVFFALRQAIYELELPRVVVRSNSNFICNTVVPEIRFWHRSNSLPLKIRKVYAEQLAELWRLLKFVEAKFEFVGDEAPLDADRDAHNTKGGNDAVSLDDPIPKQGHAKDVKQEAKTSTVYVSGAFSVLNPNVLTQRRGGCGVYWPDDVSDNVSSRVRLIPLTPHRTHIHAIYLALQAAVEKNMTHLVVKTNFPAFSKLYNAFRQQQASDNSMSLPNTWMYRKIYELEQKMKRVTFKFVDSSDPLMQQAISLAEDSLTQEHPKYKYWVNSPKKNIVQDAEVTKDSESYSRIYIFCDKTKDDNVEYRAIWENKPEMDPIAFAPNANTTLTQNMCEALVRVLKQAEERGERSLAVCVNSKLFYKSLTQWLPLWRRKDYMSSTGKPLVYADRWKEIDTHLNKVKVRWEFDDGQEIDRILKTAA